MFDPPHVAFLLAEKRSPLCGWFLNGGELSLSANLVFLSPKIV
jgi:hypothetical protein